MSLYSHLLNILQTTAKFFKKLYIRCVLLYFWPPGGGLFFDVRITKPKPSLSLRCRVTSKHSGREDWTGWTAFGNSPRGILGELLTRADATCRGCGPPSSSPSPSAKWQRAETWGKAHSSCTNLIMILHVYSSFLKGQGRLILSRGHSDLADIHFNPWTITRQNVPNLSFSWSFHK